jgi:uncharacterized protein (DUF111 family)
MTTRAGLDHGGVHDLGFARLDTDRAVRTGDPEVIHAQPEYEDVAAVAVATELPVKSVLAHAVAQARALW